MTRDTDTKLREQYAGILEAVPDALLTLEKTQTLHLPARDRDGPACSCQPDREWELVETAGALRFGGVLCHGCFQMYFEQRSRDASSSVERVDGGGGSDPNPEIVTHATADGGQPARLSSLTEQVGRASGGEKVFHAPTDEGALCGQPIDVVTDRSVLNGHFRPCTDCFDVDDE